MINWTETDLESIPQDFTIELQKICEEKEFSSNEVNDWINIGLKTLNADKNFLLEYIKQLNPELEEEKLEKKKSELEEDKEFILSLAINYGRWLNTKEGKDTNWVPLTHDSNNDELKHLREKYLHSKERKRHNAQNWIEKQYPSEEERKEVKTLNIYFKNLQGHLDLTDFINLEELNCRENWNEENRGGITSLNVSGLKKLRHLECAGNSITELNIKDCSNITYLICDGNQLTELDFLHHLDKTKIKDIQVWDNNIRASDLSVFSDFINLKYLGIGNTRIRYKNKFFGSLISLQNLTKLEGLNINRISIGNNVDLNICLLPKNLKKIFCGYKVEYGEKADKELVEKLRECGKEDLSSREKLSYFWHFEEKGYYYDYQEWRKKKMVKSADEWLKDNYPEDNDRNIKSKFYKLIISEEGLRFELTGKLNLAGFTELEELDCSGNQITNLDLSDCSNLVKINCSNNELKSLDFLKNLPNPEKLEKISIQNNPELVVKNLDALSGLTNLKELDLSNCPKVKGSLKSLEKLNQLKKISIGNTNIDDGLEFLPDSCQKLYCNNSEPKEDESKKGSTKINEIIGGKYLESEKGSIEYYNISRWKEDKRNSIALVIPLEKLFVIRSNLKQFINKWGKEHEDDWYEQLKKQIKRVKEKNNELAGLQDPKEAKQDKQIIMGLRTLSNTSAVAGIVLSFQASGSNGDDGKDKVGAGLLGVYPISEFIAAYLEKSLNTRENKWKEFLADADVFSDNFNELLAITKSIKIGELGAVNKKFRDLRKKVDSFLNEYDGDSNREIDVNELKEKRTKLSQTLNDREGKLWKVIDTIRELEEIMIDYRQGISDSERERKVGLIGLFRELANIITIVPKEIKHAIINLREVISKLNNDKSLSIDISNPETAGKVIDKEKVGKFISDLEKIEIYWNNNELEKAINSLQQEVDNYYEHQEQQQIAAQQVVIDI